MTDVSDLTHSEQVRHVIDHVVGDAFIAESTSRQRDPHDLGLSALGGCTRAAAHKIAQTEPSDDVLPSEGRAANLGTWQHNGLLPRIADQIDQAGHELEVTLRAAGRRLRGHIDLPAPGLILDLKTVAEYRLQLVRRNGPIPAHVLQVAAYGVARIQAGHPVRWLVLVYLDRASGDHETVVLPFTNRLALQAVDRVTTLVRHADDPDKAPRVDADDRALRGPGASFQCNECPWLKRCWGPDAQPGQRQARQFEDGEVEALLASYAEQRALEGEAKRNKNEILALLDGTAHGVYGSMSYGRSQHLLVDDGVAAIQMLRDLGLPVPQRGRDGAVSIRYVRAPG